MTKKTKITEDNYKGIVIRRAIFISWFLLFLFFVIKIFGGDFFEIVCSSKQFIMVCNYIESNLWAKAIIGCISTYITLSLFWLAICRKLWFNKKEIIFILIFVPINVICRLLNPIVDFIMNFVVFFIIPFFLKRNESVICTEWFVPVFIYGNLANFAFQGISVFIKNISLVSLVTENVLTALIFMIDVYIMLVLYYLYSNNKKGGKSKMGWWTSWLFGKSESQLRNMKAIRLSKIEKLQDEVKAIEAEMEKQKNESKN